MRYQSSTRRQRFALRGLVAAFGVLTAVAGGAVDARSPVSTPADGPAGLERFEALSGRTGGEATGEPIHISVVNIEKGSILFTEYRQAMEAAAGFINDTGGISGRPLELSVCATDTSPESAQACFAEVVAEEPDLVMIGLNFATAALYPNLEPLGITTVHVAPGFEADWTNPNVISYWSGPLGYATAPFQHVADNLDGIERFTVYSSDSPISYEPIEQYSVPILDAIGAETTFVLESGGAADFEPSAAQVIQSDPEAIYLSTSNAGCPGGILALRAQGYSNPFYSTPGCLSDQFIETVGDAADGIIYPTSRPDPRLPVDEIPEELRAEAELMISEFESRAPDAQLNDAAVLAFASVINVGEVMQTMANDGTEVNASSLTEALHGTGANFLSVQDYDCTGELIPSKPAFCQSIVYMQEWTAAGPVMLGEPIDVGAALDT